MANGGFNLSQALEASILNRTLNSDVEEAEAREDFQEQEEQLSEVLHGAFDDLDFSDRDKSFCSINNAQNESTEDVSSKDATYSKFLDLPEKLSNGPVYGPTNGLFNGASNRNDELSAHYKHCFGHPKLDSITEQMEKSLSSENGDPHEKFYAGGDSQQLADMYGVRMREMKRLTEKCSTLEEEWKDRCNKLKKQIYQLEAEKAALQTSCTQTQALLVDSKEENDGFRKEVNLLRQNNDSLETEVDNLSHELQVSRLAVESLQAKVQVLERGSVKKSGEDQADAVLRSTQDRHRREVNNLQNRIDKIQMKYETTESALKDAERVILEKTRQYENTLADRGEAVNRLQKALEESQRCCQEMITHQQPVQQIQQLQQQNAKLEYALDLARGDIDQLETLLGLEMLDGGGGGEWTNSNKVKAALSTEAGLRDKLATSLRHQENRRGEIKRLAEELRIKEQELADLRSQEGKYRQVVTNLKGEYEKLLKQIPEKRNSRVSSRASQEEESRLIQQLNDELTQLKQQNMKLENQKCELEDRCEYLEQQNTDLVEKTLELQRSAEEHMVKTMDAQSSEYLMFHQKAVIAARQQERKQAEDIINKIRAELDIERKEVEKVKNEYVALFAAKTAAVAELELIRDQHIEPPTHDSPDIEEKLRQQFEQKVIIETDKAKEAMLREFDNERQSLLREVTKEAKAKLEAEKLEWKKNQLPTQLVGDQALQAEILRLQKVLADQTEVMKKERQRAWSEYCDEIRRAAEHREALGLQPLNRQDRATSPLQPSTRNVKDAFTSPLPSNKDNITSSPLKDNPDFEHHIQQLQIELEQTKAKHASKLQQLQSHLQAKHQEMEDFKTKVIEYTKLQHESQEKETLEYVNVLKNEISSLNTELQETKKSTDAERAKLNAVIEKWSTELKTIKNEKQSDESKILLMQTKLQSFHTKFDQLQSYYEKRENFLNQEYKKREERVFEHLLKLKSATDSLSKLEFPHFDKPTKDL